MRFMFFYILVIFTLLADDTYPQIYSAIGDKVYECSDGFRPLSRSDNFLQMRLKLENFIAQSDKIEAMGFSLSVDNSSAKRIEYIKKLRHLDGICDELLAEVLTHLQKLFKEGSYTYLASLHVNKISAIRESKIVKISQEVIKKDDNSSNSRDSFTQIHRKFIEFKRELLQDREDENATECLNDITAVYYYLRELSLKGKECNNCDYLYAHMKMYYNSARLTCKDNPKYMQEAKNYIK